MKLVLTFVVIFSSAVSNLSLAQGFFDRVAGGIVDTINTHVIREPIPEGTRDLQIAGVKAFLRGNEADYKALMEAPARAMEGSSSSGQSFSHVSEATHNSMRRLEVSAATRDVWRGNLNGTPVKFSLPPCSSQVEGPFPRSASLLTLGRIKPGGFLAVFSVEPGGQWAGTTDLTDIHMSMAELGNCGFTGGVAAVEFDEATSIADLTGRIFEFACNWNVEPKFIKEMGVRYELPRVLFADVDGDGIKDLVVVDIDSGQGQSILRMHVVLPRADGTLRAKTVVLAEAAEHVDANGKLTESHEIKYRAVTWRNGVIYMDGVPLRKLL